MPKSFFFKLPPNKNFFKKGKKHERDFACMDSMKWISGKERPIAVNLAVQELLALLLFNYK